MGLNVTEFYRSEQHGGALCVQHCPSVRVYLGNVTWYCLAPSYVFNSSSLLEAQMTYINESINLMTSQILKMCGSFGLASF